MSYKILVVGDIHFRGTKPISRLDVDFFGTILGKIEEIRMMSKNVDLVVLLGDVVDRPDCPHSVVIRANKSFANFPVPVYSVVGNHDIHAYNGLTVNVSAIGSLFEMGNIKRLDALTIKRPDGNINLFGLHAFDADSWQVPDVSGTKILVAHKMITPTPIPNCKTFKLSDVAAATNADVILSGDMHHPHLDEINGKLFVNPGSLSRLSIDDRERQPQVAIITIDEDGPSCELKTLSVRPAETVFDLKNYSNRKASEAHTDEFIRTYVNAVVSVKAESNKIGDVLLEFLEKNGVADKMRKMEMEYLARAQKEVLQETTE